MIACRHVDPRFSFLREESSRSAGRWIAPGELTHSFCDTPDGAWAEFLRHEEIRDPRDPFTVRRALRAVDIGEVPSHRPDPPRETPTGGPDTWPACRPAAPGTCRRRRCSFDGAETRRGPPMASRRRPPTRLRTGTGRSSHCSAGAPTLSAGPPSSTAVRAPTSFPGSDISSLMNPAPDPRSQPPHRRARQAASSNTTPPVPRP